MFGVDTLRNKDVSKLKGEIILKILVLELRIFSYDVGDNKESEANPSKNK